MVINPQTGDQCTIINQDNEDFALLPGFRDEIMLEEQELCYQYDEQYIWRVETAKKLDRGFFIRVCSDDEEWFTNSSFWCTNGLG